MASMEELIAQLEATPRAIAHLALEATDSQLDAAPPGEWSARTILAHLRDLEVLLMRMRTARMLVEENPVFADFDEQTWVAGRDRSRDRKEQLLGGFALQRRASLAMLARVTPSQIQRPGTHEDGTAWTVERWIGRWVEHDRLHVAQLQTVLGETLSEVIERRARPAGETP